MARRWWIRRYNISASCQGIKRGWIIVSNVKSDHCMSWFPLRNFKGWGERGSYKSYKVSWQESNVARLSPCSSRMGQWFRSKRGWWIIPWGTFPEERMGDDEGEDEHVNEWMTMGYVLGQIKSGCRWTGARGTEGAFIPTSPSWSHSLSTISERMLEDAGGCCVLKTFWLAMMQEETLKFKVEDDGGAEESFSRLLFLHSQLKWNVILSLVLVNSLTQRQ